MKIDPEHVMAFLFTTYLGLRKMGGIYGIRSLQSNTPLREVIDASSRIDKKIFIINVFPHNHDKL